MERITEAEAREPDVNLIVPLEKWHALPDDAQELLRYFIVSDDIVRFQFRLPAYRWRELQTMTLPGQGEGE